MFDVDQRDCPASNVNLVCSAVNLMANCSVQGGCEFDGVVCGVVNLMARDLLGNMLVLSAAVNYLTIADNLAGYFNFLINCAVHEFVVTDRMWLI